MSLFPLLAYRRVSQSGLQFMLLVLWCAFLGGVGCSRFHPKAPSESVYVLAKQTVLRDRVAAVSNRVGVVQNGQKLTVLERGRRFLKVSTEKGEVGWIEERAVVPPAVLAGFEELSRQHGPDAAVGTAVLRDELYMHLKPGRETERFYLLPENDKLQLLVRASVPKSQPPQALAPVHRAAKPGLPDKKSGLEDKGKGGAVAAGGGSGAAARPADGAEPPAMEDWWLARDGRGRVGWVLARRIDVEVPDSVAQYSEGQRMVGAFVLTRVIDPESSLPGNQVPVYVTVLAPFKDGLPYDFDQIRVFTWNLKKHRYETAYRQRNLQGHLPVVVKEQNLDGQGPVPTFEFRQAVGDGVITDPQTGAMKPAQTETETYRLDGVIVKKVAAPAAAGGRVAGPAAGTHREARHSRRMAGRAGGRSARKARSKAVVKRRRRG